ncbi:MAG: Pantothenate precursors transporter PanS [Chroococcidiopsis sp. SAG 2025]|uniref:bile acid:sodium symporter family protein n=1 Tax=Chroococcidiopsis sp. SAG 2025 TaxID=171389 RepID=UPI000D07CB83|nr:bile acid:sodium symporter family protein [Chroococcidiopsis sp. SAG 2025]MDV2997207.1 Pantothenate precursors transporter PanS [Chroococcidiopsis sp. SAG 2025]PSB47112.1 bile acid:sodium symporter [Cyanosarcina cf. burmensis CCALA 770]
MQANFFTAVLLPIGLATVMLGMGLTLVPKDFQRVTRYPKAVAIGLVSQLLFLPIVGFLVASIVSMQPAIAVGLMVLALCPGGPSSNMITYLAKGDVALSVTLTALSSAITVFTIPIFANFSLQYFVGQSAAIALPIGQTMLQIFAIAILPIIVGMTIRQKFPNLARRLEKTANRLAITFLALIILVLIVHEWNRIPSFIAQVGIAVVLLNTISMAIGFWFGKLFNLNFAQRICIAIEVGIQNATLAIAITAGLLNNPDMAVPAAVYSLFAYATAILSIFYGRRSVQRIDREERSRANNLSARP